MFLKKIDESFSLTLGMAERLGVDVTSTVSTDPEVNAIALRSAVFKCSACKQQKACKSLQAKHSQLDAAPDYCRNW